MFFLSELTKEFSLYSKDITHNIKNLMSEKIRSLEGQIIGKAGFVVSITEFNFSPMGIIDNETGQVNYIVNYKAITCRPVENEVLDVIFDTVNRYGLFCTNGIYKILVSNHSMTGWNYDEQQNKWVKSKTKALLKEIIPGQKVRIKITAFRINSNEISALAELY